MTRTGKRAGFTLLEVMIAIMIFVLAIAAILPLFAVGTTSHRRGMDQSHLAWIAPKIAAKIQENLYDINPKPIRGAKYEEYGTTYTFDATFRALALASKDDPIVGGAFLLRVEVRHLEDSQERVEVFETVVLRKLLR